VRPPGGSHGRLLGLRRERGRRHMNESVEGLQGIVVHLASDMSRYQTGDTITLGGGMIAQCY